MWPGSLEGGFVLIGVIVRVVQRRERAKGVGLDHSDNLWVDGFCQNSLVAADEVQDLIQSSSLDLLGPKVNHGIGKLKNVAALFNLPQKETGSVLWRCI